MKRFRPFTLTPTLLIVLASLCPGPARGDLREAAAPAAGWAFEQIAPAPNWSDFSPRALALEHGTGRPHAVYGAYGLIHAWFDGQRWRTEVIDAARGSGRFAALAVDEANRLHVSYRDDELMVLKYATNASGSWEVTVVDDEGSQGWGTAIALDAAGRAHIAYRTDGTGDLRYATNAGGGWIATVVEETDNVGLSPSIAVDSLGQVHIGYHNATDGTIRYAVGGAGAWTRLTVDSGYASARVSLALDAAGTPHLAYCGWQESLSYARRDGGGWNVEVVDDSAGNGQTGCSLALDAAGNATVSYSRGSQMSGFFKIATNAGGGWTVGDLPGYGGDSSVAIGADGTVHVAVDYPANGAGGNLSHLRSSGAGWERTLVQTEGETGWWGDLALGADGGAHVSYWDYRTNAVRHATNASGAWVTEDVAAGQAWYGTGIAVDSAGRLHMCWGGNSLIYATNASGAWLTSAVDTQAGFYLGEYCDIALDDSDNVHFSYQMRSTAPASTDRRLRYAAKIGASWQKATVDTGNVGGRTSIAIDGAGKAHISYWDVGNADLKYATNSPGPAWVPETVDTDGDVGVASSIAVEPGGAVHIGYFDNTLRQARHARLSGTWTLESYGVGGFQAALALDSRQQVHMTYYGPWGQGLQYATTAPHNQPSTSLVDNRAGYEFNGTNAVAVDARGRVHALYLADRALWYATEAKPAAPRMAGATAVQPNAVVVTWEDGSTVEDGFSVERREGSCSSTDLWRAVGAAGRNATAWTDGGVRPQTRYAYRVRAFRDGLRAEYSAPSGCVSVLTPRNGTPAAPQQLKASAGGSGVVVLNWRDRARNETSFKIMRREGSGPWRLAATLGANARGWRDTKAAGAGATTLYAYKVSACNRLGCSPVTSPAAVPLAAVGLGATTAAAGTSRIDLSWTGPGAGESGFRLFSRLGPCAAVDAWLPLGATGRDVTAYADGGLVPGSLHSYRVTAYARSRLAPFSLGYSLPSACADGMAP